MPSAATVDDTAEPKDEMSVPQWAFVEALDKLVVMVIDLGKKLDTDATNRKSEQALLNLSIENVHT
jgi:hypothetical protein